MKITIIVPIIGNFGRKGYYHSQEIGLGKELVNAGHEVRVIKCVSNSKLKQKEQETIDGVYVLYLPVKHFGPHGMFPCNEIAKDSDVVFTFADTQFIVPQIYKFCEKNRIRFIPYVGIAHSFQQNLKSKIMDLLFSLTTLRVYQKINVVCKTRYAAEELKHMGVKKCSIAPVGMDFEALRSDYEITDRNSLRMKYGLNQNDSVISFIGRFQPEKRPLDMVKIFAKVDRPNKKMIMVGDGPERKIVEDYILANALSEQITIIPQVKYEDMWEIHYISDFFVNLRAEEIFGMAVMEAVYYKSCVIARSAPGPDTILNGMKGHYICQNDDEVTRFLSECEVNKRDLSKSAQKLCDEFTWAKCAEAIIQYHA